jgi:hypothetical protein
MRKTMDSDSLDDYLTAYGLDPLFPDRISRADLLKDLMPGLNALFGLEYKKYEAEHTKLYGSANG